MRTPTSAAGRTRRAFLLLLMLSAWMRTPSVVRGMPESARPASELDTIPRLDYLRHHAFSLDNFLESRPGGLLVRAGPIGYEARYSRWGIGRGRARLLANGIVLNDPQNDVAPLAHTATSGLGWLAFGESARQGAAPWIEGGLTMDDLPAPLERPHTFVELSKGTNDLRQRRVRFCSEAGIAGLDLAYDEVLDDGYMFDAGNDVVLGPDYGRARSRNVALAVRGSPDERTGYALGVRRFQSTTTGDLTNAANAGTHDGHLVWMDARASGVRLLAYGRGYTSSHPDSATTNETVGGVLGWDAPAGRRATASLAARVEHTRSTVDVGAAANPSLTQGTLTAAGAWRTGSALSLTADGSVAGDDETAFAWGASGAIRWSAGSNAVVARAMRAFRMPNLGERYLPSHLRDGLTLVGDPDLDPETAIEAGVDWEVRGRGMVNRVRAAWIRSADTIAFRVTPSGAPGERRAANAADDRAMRFVEERADADFPMGPLRVRAGGSVVYSDGEREEAFASVPRITATATALLGGEMFERTSALYVGGEFVHVDERTDYAGTALPAFDVLNLVLEGRLLDARLYLKYLNVLDEPYRTEGDYLMTPATFVYGIEWTLFD